MPTNCKSTTLSLLSNYHNEVVKAYIRLNNLILIALKVLNCEVIMEI